MVIVSILLAILALSFLIFIHELGHYFMAKRVGMRVETFSIGMGSPLFSWKSGDTTWQIGWLPVGGFVRIAGTDTDKNKDLEKVKDGYFSKSPWDRIKVSFMGPLVNILFALLAFALLWISGGREKSFSEYTKKIGLVDPKSELYAKGIREGDEIWSLNGKPYLGVQDLVYLGVTNKGPVSVKGAKVNYATGEKNPFELTVEPYPHPLKADSDFLTTGVLAPANYLIYDRLPSGKENLIPDLSPLKNSGIEYGDQIVWIDGRRVFSLAELSSLLNDNRALLTVERNGKTFLARVPRVKTHDIKMTPAFRDELTDWQFAAQLNAIKFPLLLTLPYNLTNNGIVENPMSFVDPEDQSTFFPAIPQTELEQSLLAGDKIIAVDGISVRHASEILKRIQERHVHLIVNRSGEQDNKISWQTADLAFDKNVPLVELNAIGSTIGTPSLIEQKGSLILLKPIAPKMHKDLYAGSLEMNQIVEAQKKQIAAISDPVKKAQAEANLEKTESKLELGLPIRDQRVDYNPVPTTQFFNVMSEIGRTLKALFTGALNPKWMSGPVGIVNLFQEQTRSGLGETLFWLGTISLNLGFLNLLPIPMLDGGTIVINLIEMITGRKIKPETLEKIILPFFLLLIVFFLFLTYNDITRLFGGPWKP